MWPFKNVRYRIRIFDHGLHVKTAEVIDRGQQFITLVVKGKKFGLFGDEIKLSFQINPEIRPKIFGNVFEVDFDFKDTTQLGDLLDIDPDLVFRINENYRNIWAVRKIQSKTIDADFVEKISLNQDPKNKDEEGKNSLLARETPVASETALVEQKDDANKSLIDPDEQEKTIGKKIELGIKDSIQVIKILREIKKLDDTQIEKRQKIQTALDFCTKYPKMLYWLPHRLGIGQEIHAIVSQSRIERVGIKPSTYTAEVNSRHVEKTLSRPKSEDDWKMTLIIVIGLLGTLGIIAGILYIVIHH